MNVSICRVYSEVSYSDVAVSLVVKSPEGVPDREPVVNLEGVDVQAHLPSLRKLLTLVVHLDQEIK